MKQVASSLRSWEITFAGVEERYLRQIYLAGSGVLETNATRVNDTSAPFGEQPMTSFHQEYRALRKRNIYTPVESD